MKKFRMIGNKQYVDTYHITQRKLGDDFDCHIFFTWDALCAWCDALVATGDEVFGMEKKYYLRVAHNYREVDWLEKIAKKGLVIIHEDEN